MNDNEIGNGIWGDMNRQTVAGIAATSTELAELNAFVARKNAKIVDYKTTLWATAAFLAAFLTFLAFVPLVILAIKVGAFLWAL